MAALALAVAVALGCRASNEDLITPITAEADVAPEVADDHSRDFGRALHEERSDGLFAYTDPGELPRLMLAGDEQQQLPLRHTDVDARVRGHVAEVLVTQTFHNDRREAIEVIYTFPLPENAAVADMRVVIGERVIESEVQRREQARQTYEDARSEGYTAALLEQQRPNVFRQSVANVPPGATIEVELSYLQTLTQDAGTHEFVFPMVVGPRFVPPGSPPADAAITPPILGDGQRTGHDVSLTLAVDAGMSVTSWDAPSHTVTGIATAQGFSARLADAETIPNRDFVIRWDAADQQPRATLYLGPKDEAGLGHFSMVVMPPKLELDALVGRREMIFVVDRSGSMNGAPLALAKQTLREALKRLRPVDTFDVVGFESQTERLFGTPRPANEHNRVLAERFIDGMQARGGTMMSDAVTAALAPRLSEGRHRYVLFLTDGYIANEEQIFAGASALVRRAEQGGARARVFGLGIGSAPNSHLIAGLSAAGDAEPLYVGNREHPRLAIDTYYRYVDHPVLEDLQLDWGGLAIEDVYPSDSTSLFASHAVVMIGRYRGQIERAPTLYATVAGSEETIELEVVVAASDHDDRILSTLWAREKIAALTAARWDAAIDFDELESQVTGLGLAYHLVTAYTSLVAVDRSRRVGDGSPIEIVQPVEVPEDVDAKMAGSTVIVRENVSVSNALAVRRTSDPAPRERHTRLSIGALIAADGANERELRRSLTRRSLILEACYQQYVGIVGKAALRYRLRFDESGAVVGVELLGATRRSEGAHRCIEAVLWRIDWAGLPSGANELELELRLRMR